MPDTRASSGAEAVWHRPPTAVDAISTTASSECDNLCSLRSCWYWPTPIDFGSILDQFGQRVLEPAGDRTAPRRGDVEVRGVPPTHRRKAE